MKLQDIGFYTLSDERARQCSVTSPLMRCELLLTNRCNFKCPYCRGGRPDLDMELSYNKAFDVVNAWAYEGLQNIRFSGGEPTLWPMLPRLASFARSAGVERIAISTNGSAEQDLYAMLIERGVNDFSVSLDACCAGQGDLMAGKPGAWANVVGNIPYLSSRVYTTVGMVFTEENVDQAVESVLFADSLGVSDIRVVPSAQFNQALTQLADLPQDMLDKYPILQYRIAHVMEGRNVRGLEFADCGTCRLALDDMAVAGGYHFPCIIHLREGGDPIGKVGSNMRAERAAWVSAHNSHVDPICRQNCLDVCIDYNNRADELKRG